MTRTQTSGGDQNLLNLKWSSLFTSIIIVVIIICPMHESWTMCHESTQDAGVYINRQPLPTDPMSDANRKGAIFFLVLGM